MFASEKHKCMLTLKVIFFYLQCADQQKELKCKVCNEPVSISAWSITSLVKYLFLWKRKRDLRSNFYFLFQYKVSGGWSWFPRGLKPRHWLQTFLVLIVITSVPFITYAVTHSVTSLYIRIFVIGVCVLLEIGCLRYV